MLLNKGNNMKNKKLKVFVKLRIKRHQRIRRANMKPVYPFGIERV